jgi:hypothetical protein
MILNNKPIKVIIYQLSFITSKNNINLPKNPAKGGIPAKENIDITKK